MGGHDPYSMSKGAAELVTAQLPAQLLPGGAARAHGVAVATARAGNVIGGGDWAEDRIVPDASCARSRTASRSRCATRTSVRPWQHVLEPLGGYLLLGARLGNATAASACEAWNFGPRAEASRTVRELVEAVISSWGGGRWDDQTNPDAPHEAKVLRLSIEKAASRLGWAPRWGFAETVHRTVTWYRAQMNGATADELVALCRADIDAYQRA